MPTSPSTVGPAGMRALSAAWAVSKSNNQRHKSNIESSSRRYSARARSFLRHHGPRAFSSFDDSQAQCRDFIRPLLLSVKGCLRHSASPRLLQGKDRGEGTVDPACFGPDFRADAAGANPDCPRFYLRFFTILERFSGTSPVKSRRIRRAKCSSAWHEIMRENSGGHTTMWGRGGWRPVC